MDKQMKEITESIWHRFKKLFILLLLIPVLTTVVAYFMASKAPSTSQATAKVKLGQAENSILNTPDSAKEYLTSEEFLRSVKGLNKDEEKAMKDKLQVVPETDTIITLSLMDEDKSKAKSQLKPVVKEFMKESNHQTEKWKTTLEDQIKKVEGTQVSGEGTIKKEEYLFDLKTRVLKVKEPKLLEKVDTTDMAGDPKRKAVLGLLVGLMLSASILLLPEIFKK
ncbi:hypothetical protein LCY76_19180 [Fictibacillus sp. KIGAM418]|uniref:Teichuronic acid biosynthesis protein TuaF n=1 Tax=Fictibacillus marinisediminis TaxID=2878389 RepID=A0A9X1XDH6_9BACL|nr:hypothetical protein [Fictibacillus marinisediminis]MCK6258694.1 hypothetical protein [Fictibacillus marinisediminis]